MKLTPEQREEIANRIADEGWCPNNITLVCEGGYEIQKWMYISDSDIDDYIAEMNQCAAEDHYDNEREERMLEERGK